MVVLPTIRFICLNFDYLVLDLVTVDEMQITAILYIAGLQPRRAFRRVQCWLYQM